MLSPLPENADRALATLLGRYSVEVISKDLKGIDEAALALRPGAEVFVASLPGPSGGPERLVEACARAVGHGLTPVPHIVARNVPSLESFEDTTGRLADVGVRRVLVLGGDRDEAAGPYDSASGLMATGVLQRLGVTHAYFGGHPEGHPRVADGVIWNALLDKLRRAEEDGLQTGVVTQFAFDPEPYLALARRLRKDGVTAPLFAGVAGPANRTTLIKYAIACGVGASLRNVRERQERAKGLISGETPNALLLQLAAAQQDEPELNFAGVHFFTFGSVSKTIEYAEEALKR